MASSWAFISASAAARISGGSGSGTVGSEFRAGTCANASATSAAEGRAAGSFEIIRSIIAAQRSGTDGGTRGAQWPPEMRCTTPSVVGAVGNGAPAEMQRIAPSAYTSPAWLAPSPCARSGERYGAVFTRFCIKRFSPRRSLRRFAMTSGMSHRLALPVEVSNTESRLISPCTTPCECTVANASDNCDARLKSSS